MPDAVDTVICAPDDGWRYHPKHVEQFQVINCVTLHLVVYILEYARSKYYINLYTYQFGLKLTVASRQHRECIIPQPVTHSLVFLKMGKIISRNMLS